MVLVVLTTLMISFVAIFSQMVVNQTAKIYNAENAFMQNMMTWHAGALAFVHNVLPVPMNTTGCLLTTATVVTHMPAACLSGTMLGAPYISATSNYSFYSMAFQSTTGANSGNYVLTFVCTTNPATPATAAACTTDGNGFVQLPGGAGSVSTGFNPGDLMSQLKRAAPLDASYGSVTASGTFTQTTPSINNKNGQTYDIPDSIPIGAVGIISPAD